MFVRTNKQVCHLSGTTYNLFTKDLMPERKLLNESYDNKLIMIKLRRLRVLLSDRFRHPQKYS